VSDGYLWQPISNRVKWIYFAPCGPNYLFPEVGISTINILKRFLGNGIFMDGSCCGLLSYNYGNLKEAKRFARKNIMKFEEITKTYGFSPDLTSVDAIIVGDCSSCIAFMKSYEQLFTDDEIWRQRALKFAKSVRDILEVLPEEKIKKITCEKFKKLKISKVTYHDSCRACHGQSITREPRKILNKLLGENFIELPESDWCCGGAGTFYFTQKKLSSEILKRKIRNIASIQSDTVIASATSCLIQIENGLKQHYPCAKIMHYSMLIDKLTSDTEILRK
jgi:glycolate oxidase iron-sulfur subunit